MLQGQTHPRTIYSSAFIFVLNLKTNLSSLSCVAERYFFIPVKENSEFVP